MDISISKQLISLKEASIWATDFLKKDISVSNISYLVQYGKIKKHIDNGSSLVDIEELRNYYKSHNGRRELAWKKRLGDDLNWALSFDHLREKDTTKHVHRLHPYKGKFIPQLVQYFIDNHTDDFKTKTFFKKGDIILDPFSGSGTTLVQANELGMHSIGIDISRFNCMIAEIKLFDYDLGLLTKEIREIQKAITSFEVDTNISEFEKELYRELQKFNYKHFPSPNFKRKIYQGEINEAKYAEEKDKLFLQIYDGLIRKYKIGLKQSKNKTFLDKWYIQNVRKEIDFAFEQVKKVKDGKNKRILAVILSRTIRSCRATTHSDLATLKEPQLTTYYCWKHKKICKPLFSIKYWFTRYVNDTITRLKEFQKFKTSAHHLVISADSRIVNLNEEIQKRHKELFTIFKEKKIRGIFTSPPYVGQINYHEQHAYAYDLFGFERKDHLEIGPLYNGRGEEARKSYIDGVSQVLLNCKKYLADNFDIFLVANDRCSLYPVIVQKAGLIIANRFKRPVLNRTERDKSPYSEIIFHLKNNF